VCGRQAGTDHIDAVERGLGGDAEIVLGKAERLVGDADLEMLGHVAPSQHRADGLADRRSAVQRAARPLHARHKSVRKQQNVAGDKLMRRAALRVLQDGRAAEYHVIGDLAEPQVSQPVAVNGRSPVRSASLSLRCRKQRMRRCRARRRAGYHCLTVELHDGEIEALVRRGLLREDEREEEGAVVDALSQYIEQTLGPPS